MFGKKYNEILSSLSIYYKKDSGNYFDSITHCHINEVPHQLGKYYLDFSSKAYYSGNFDEDGIPLYQDYYHPIVISQYAFGLYELIFKNNFSDVNLIKKFLKQADWLVNNSVKVNGKITWLVNKKILDYGLDKPFSSGLAQGEAISVLLRAYSINNNQIYFDCAEKALQIFEMDVKDGGIKNVFKNNPIYEEYPSPKPNFVLNGFIFSLFGLYDFILFNKNSKATELFEQGIKTLENLLSLFDTGYWSQYNLFFYPEKYLASAKYHIIHIEQLKALNILTDKKIFLEYSNKWNNYSNSFIIKTYALIKKIMKKNVVKE